MTSGFRREMEAALEQMAGRRVLVVGDVIADHYLFGRPTRISREAPVLILSHEGEEILPGGAGNAAQNVRALGGEVVLVGVLGEDAVARELIAALERSGVRPAGIVRAPGRPTPVKTRILAGGGKTVRQQVVRIDRQPAGEPGASVRAAVARSVAQFLPWADACIISDYGLGALSPEVRSVLLSKGRKTGPLLAVDARYDLLAYPGADVVTPNQLEAETALGSPLRTPGEVALAARHLARRLACPSVLVTQGDEGMTLLAGDGPAVHIHAVDPTEVFDVTGAGDTVIGTFVLALVAGARPLVAALLANLAAGLVVRKLGAATVTPQELRRALARWRPVYEAVELPGGGMAAEQRGG